MAGALEGDIFIGPRAQVLKMRSCLFLGITTVDSINIGIGRGYEANLKGTASNSS